MMPLSSDFDEQWESHKSLPLEYQLKFLNTLILTMDRMVLKNNGRKVFKVRVITGSLALSVARPEGYGRHVVPFVCCESTENADYTMKKEVRYCNSWFDGSCETAANFADSVQVDSEVNAMRKEAGKPPLSTTVDKIMIVFLYEPVEQSE